MWYRLDLPKLELPEIWYTHSVQLESQKVQGYKSYYVTDQCNTIVRNMFPDNFLPAKTKIIAQLIDPRLNGCIHQDKREYAINYVVNSGGLNAHTSVYSGDQVEIGSYIQHPGEWVLLNTFKNHAVHDITDTRISLSISFYEFGDVQWNWLNDKMQSEQTV